MEGYNGYTSKEREKKLRAMHKAFPNYSHPYYSGPCDICGDPESSVAPHSEDYSEPYLWERPAEYAVCRTCHSRLHKRFADPYAWAAYKAHLKRGGFGSDLKLVRNAAEVKRLASALEASGHIELAPMRPIQNDRWWDQLTVDPASKTAAWARARR